jgi:transposase
MISVGMDISKDKINVCVSLNAKAEEEKKKSEFTIKNDTKDFPKFLQKTKALKINNDDLQVVMEPTGIYSLPLATWLYKKHIKVFMVNPYKAKHYALSEGNGSKNDIIDARMLASYGETHKLVAWAPKSEIVIKLDYLLSRIGQLVDMRTQEKNHLEKADFSPEFTKRMKQDVKRIIAIFDSEIKLLEEEIEKCLKSCPTLFKERERLMTMPGIGKTTGLALVLHFNEREYKSAEHLVSFTGLAPKERQSGKYKGETHISKKGPSQIRGYLYMAAQSAAKYNLLFSKKYKENCAIGKNKNAQLCVIMRKILIISYSMWRNETVFDCDYEKKRRAELQLKKIA